MKPTLLQQLITDSPVCLSIMITIFVVSVISFIKRSLFLKLILHPYSIVKEHQYYRIITADLVHNDFLHLLLNEFMLITFCANLEQFLRSKTSYGSLGFLVIYLLSCFSGAIAATIRYRKDFDYSSAGASGSIMGCMFSYIILQPNIIAYFVPGIGAVKNIYGGLLFIIALIIYQRRSKNTFASHEVHFFGALGGIVTTIILFPGLL